MTVLEPSSMLLLPNKRKSFGGSPEEKKIIKKPFHLSTTSSSHVNEDDDDDDNYSDTTAKTSNQEWLFRRQQGDTMVLYEHLGDTSAIVESLTHQVDNWSLTKTNPSSSSSIIKKQKCRAAKRQVMRAMARTGKTTTTRTVQN
eukprot:scaffold6638_cov127-Cylindrotheca_fusiformis.AAC.19